MKKLIIPCITLILTFILAISVSAESLPALHPGCRGPPCQGEPLHPAENIQTGVTEQMVAALTKTVPHIRLHPAEKLKTGFSAAYITEHYNICEVSHATGETALGEKLNIVSYRLQPKDTQSEALLLIDEVQDASSDETLYFTLHYGDFDTGEVTRAEVIYP